VLSQHHYDVIDGKPAHNVHPAHESTRTHIPLGSSPHGSGRSRLGGAVAAQRRLEVQRVEHDATGASPSGGPWWAF